MKNKNCQRNVSACNKSDLNIFSIRTEFSFDKILFHITFQSGRPLFRMSTWNSGNWFWEEHNANKWAKERLTELVNGISVEGWTFSDFDFKSIQAAKSIRKNREIRSFEIVLEFKWKYGDMEGKINFPDVSNDCVDSPDEWEYELTFTGDSNKKTAAEKKAIRVPADANVIPLFRKAFAQWADEFKNLPATPRAE